MELVNLRVEKIEIDIEKGLFTVSFENKKELVCRLVRDLTDGEYRRAINPNSLGMYYGKTLRENEWLQKPGHNEYENYNEIVSVILREANKAGLTIL